MGVVKQFHMPGQICVGRVKGVRLNLEPRNPPVMCVVEVESGLSDKVQL